MSMNCSGKLLKFSQIMGPGTGRIELLNYVDLAWTGELQLPFCLAASLLGIAAILSAPSPCSFLRAMSVMYEFHRLHSHMRCFWSSNIVSLIFLYQLSKIRRHSFVLIPIHNHVFMSIPLLHRILRMGSPKILTVYHVCVAKSIHDLSRRGDHRSWQESFGGVLQNLCRWIIPQQSRVWRGRMWR